MTPEDSKAQQKALKALIAASLRAPANESEVTEQDIKRFVDQNVTLSEEDKAALEKAEPKFFLSITHTLAGSQQSNDDCIEALREQECAEPFAAMNRKNATDEFSKLTESELDRKREEMLSKLRQKKGHAGS